MLQVRLNVLEYLYLLNLCHHNPMSKLFHLLLVLLQSFLQLLHLVLHEFHILCCYLLLLQLLYELFLYFHLLLLPMLYLLLHLIYLHLNLFLHCLKFNHRQSVLWVFYPSKIFIKIQIIKHTFISFLLVIIYFKYPSTWHKLFNIIKQLRIIIIPR